MSIFTSLKKALTKVVNKVKGAVVQAFKKTTPVAKQMITRSFRFILECTRRVVGVLTLALVAALAKRFAYKEAVV